MKKNKSVQETQVQTIQRYITEGREVMIKKESEILLIRIRYNNEDTDGSKRWRTLVNGNEFYSSEIIINCSSRTISENFENIGVKHHIICEAKELVFKNNIANIN